MTARAKTDYLGSVGTNAARWFKSSYSTFNGNCVEAALLPGNDWAIRDSKNKAAGILTFDAREWAAFVAAIKNHELDA